ncbi:hypothetical protein B1690_05995 [Geobacillus sp. 46C-IIa]|uniref:peptidoglycan-binding protein n=1 Tax=Geobacillus sp. 46C-IIa TaxID=1963025 RepID=UPI0009BD2665|nr:peptidoglycan-binding protein [Geobacillus sp. 46C-IIa]OQP06860.1 hypothetical protein B1690_05995 [Geobacillus sp. 46C-IIa]QNU27421.1 peptidoglycan-binding protein [Geobacillus sp. 46C-IIa]
MYVVDGASRIIYYPSNYTNYLWSGQTLKRGDRNDYVKTLQSWLYKAGFNPGGIDGVYGANTEKAVKEFQKKVGITADGIAGKQTYQALQKYVRTQTTLSRSNSSSSNDHWTGQTLREGSEGQAVKDLQTKLQRLGYNVGAVDGIYGKQTTEAVRSFQKANGLEVDGIAGKITYNAIEHMLQQKNYYDKKTIIENKYRSLEAKVHSRNSTWDEVSESLKEIAKLGFDFIIGDDIKTLLNPSADTIDKVIAALSFIPTGKLLNGAIKLSKVGEKIAVKIDSKILAVGKEVILPKVDTFEQARNIALEIVGDLGSNSKPVIGRLKTSKGYGKVIGRMSADEKVRWRLDYDPEKGIHINVEDYRNGKGQAIKVCIPFKGDEKTFESLLKHLNK